MAYRNQNYMTNRKIKEEVDKNQKGYSEEVIEEFEPQTYYFQSYDDAQGTTLWGSGTVKTTGVEENNFTQVQILTNDTVASFINQKVFVASNATADATTLYPLYSDAGITPLNIYVKISTSEFEEKQPEQQSSSSSGNSGSSDNPNNQNNANGTDEPNSGETNTPNLNDGSNTGAQ